MRFGTIMTLTICLPSVYFWVCSSFSTVFSCWIIYSTMDTSALAYLIPAVFAEMASATGFYYTKAKAENKIKLMNANGVQPEADNFNDF